ncbi:MAG: hypothetical protein MJ104_04465 [Lachnospiraceae bacterium]|nr:hypothetical protein [Lachnospiraceae bacterium]
MDYYSHKSEEEREKFIIVGETVTELLKKALQDLKKAKGWSKIDLIGGGWLSTSEKQKFMQRAKAYVADAVDIMEKYGREYKSVAYGLGTSALETNNSLGNADYGSHDRYVDSVMNERIVGAMETIESAISKIEDLMAGI